MMVVESDDNGNDYNTLTVINSHTLCLKKKTETLLHFQITSRSDPLLIILKSNNKFNLHL